MTVLITGGMGFIGSHTTVALAGQGQKTIILDNLCNSKVEVLDRIERISGSRPFFVQGDVRDSLLLDRVFQEYDIEAVIHFAGLKSVGESVQKPLEYYDTNVRGAVEILSAMRRHSVRKFIFSSSATVYGDAASVPYVETAQRQAVSPYGRTKLVVEDLLTDLFRADSDWRFACLRYFNPAGAHESGLIGEDPEGVPNNLMPYIAQVAVGRRERLSIFGGDYPTKDVTGVRDYIHVMDLAEGYLAALNYLNTHAGHLTVNLGRGEGISVLEMVHAFERASGRPIPFDIVEKRSGDLAQFWANSTLAKTLLGWQANRDINAMCADAWRWQQFSEKRVPCAI